MTKESKQFFKKYWQALVIGITLQIVIGIIISTGSLRLALKQIEDNKNTNKVQDQSVFELQMNQQTMSTLTKTNKELPYSYTMSRGIK